MRVDVITQLFVCGIKLFFSPKFHDINRDLTAGGLPNFYGFLHSHRTDITLLPRRPFSSFPGCWHRCCGYFKDGRHEITGMSNKTYLFDATLIGEDVVSQSSEIFSDILLIQVEYTMYRPDLNPIDFNRKFVAVQRED